MSASLNSVGGLHSQLTEQIEERIELGINLVY